MPILVPTDPFSENFSLDGAIQADSFSRITRFGPAAPLSVLVNPTNLESAPVFLEEVTGTPGYVLQVNAAGDGLEWGPGGGGGGGSQGWDDVLAIEFRSGASNPHIDEGQYLSFHNEDALPTAGDIRSSGVLHIEALDLVSIHTPFDVQICTHAGGSMDSFFVHADNVRISTNGSERLEFLPDGEWEITGAVGTAGQYIRSFNVGFPPAWATIAFSEITGGTWSDVLTRGATSGANNPSINSSQKLIFAGGGTSGGDIDAAGVFVIDAVTSVGVTTAGVSRLVVEADGSWNIGGNNGTDGQVLRSFGSAAPPQWASVAFADMPSLAGLSVLGRSASSSGVMAAITATAARQALMSNSAGTAIAWRKPTYADIDGWFLVTDFGAVGDGVTDDTAAIQATIDACIAAGGGTVYFPDPPVDYLVAGALQDTGRSNAQLLLPRILISGSVEPLSIRLLGATRPTALPSVVGAIDQSTSGTIIRSTLASGTGSMIGAWGPVGSFQDFSSCRVEIQNLTFRMVANSTNSCVDLSHVATSYIDAVGIDAGEYDISAISLQSTATSFGLKLPANNNGASLEVGRVDIIGFYNGVLIGEHTTAEHIATWGCRNGLVVPAGNHASILNRMMAVWCKVAVTFTGEHTISISQLDIEHAASGTWTPTLDVSDVSNFARGSLFWHVVLSGSGANNTLLVSGATFLQRTHLYYDGLVFQLTDGATVTVDCNISDNFRWFPAGNRAFANPTNPHDSQIIHVRIIQDATGNRVWTPGSKFLFVGPSALSTAAGAEDLLVAQYDASRDTWISVLSKAVASGVTWNPSDTHADITLSSGNLVATKGGTNALRSTRATLGKVDTDNGYFEILVGGTEVVSNFRLVGISTLSMLTSIGVGQDANSWAYYQETGQKYTNNVGSAYGTTWTNGDVLGIAFKNGSVWFAKNNVWQNSGDPAAGTGAAFTGITGTVFPTAALYKGSAPVHIATGRFRSTAFTYSPPTGFQPWDTSSASIDIAAANTYYGNASGVAAARADVAISNLAGTGMTATGSVLNVIGSTSITVNADDIQRPALTGAITAAANSNTTAFGVLAAKSVLANATNASAVPAALAGSAAFQHLRVNSANTALEWAVLAVTSPITLTSDNIGFDQTVALGNNARVAVSKNSGATVGTRRRINLIEGTGVTLTIADDAGNEEVDVTIASAATAGTVTPTTLSIFGTPTNTGVPFIIYVTFAAGAGGSADDVTVFSSSAPFNFRILESWLITTTAVALSTVQARTATGGGGTALSTAMSATVAGKTSDNSTATATVAASGTMVLRRSDSGIAGEFFAMAIRT